MIITCPNCSARYLVDPEEFGHRSRKVRCLKCEHNWLQPIESLRNPSQEDQALEEKALKSHKKKRRGLFGFGGKKESQAGLPALGKANFLSEKQQQGKPFILLRALPYALLIMVFLCGFFTYRVSVLQHLPAVDALYQAIGIYKTEGLQLENINVERNPKDQTSLLISGEIKNYASVPRRKPSIRFVIYNDRLDEIREGTIDFESYDMLQPGETLTIPNRISNITESASYIVIEFGNWLDLMLRS